MAEVINIKVNGKTHRVTADPEMPLLYLLRNNLQLNGPKYGCGIERCGSCMVLLNGKAQPSCVIPGSAAAVYEVTTLEGFSINNVLDPIQEAFIEEQAAQCGYCTSGMIISAKALLTENKNPTDQQIRQALQRNLCRCGTHTRIINAVKKAAAKLNK
ncbi:(2Fe-2S)-binding protein [Dyadobacter chenhuakuii]|uniref:(2Fe-2S)-binding protein n=1 Tax=Dyadobacter chenhuakuii TaxID=2909339 RepID=A0ABY4XIW4_9BACT|nr:(2Fe-2S)-binding protein [Dyadobacter chenhuakuii]MCF2496244.1 (2Fe-2S)-binding protein [Dyadobacter chenhuakuii]USJ30305.1 (2Fe-2S)-binding protein [Dyadobacter chenhuakuii]